MTMLSMAEKLNLALTKAGLARTFAGRAQSSKAFCLDGLVRPVVDTHIHGDYKPQTCVLSRTGAVDQRALTFELAMVEKRQLSTKSLFCSFCGAEDHTARFCQLRARR